MKTVIRFGKKEKLAPRHIGQFEIRSRVGEVAYSLVLLPELSRITSSLPRVDVENIYCGSFACTSASGS